MSGYFDEKLINFSVLALLCFMSLFSVSKQAFFDKSCADYNVTSMPDFKKTEVNTFLIDDFIFNTKEN